MLRPRFAPVDFQFMVKVRIRVRVSASVKGLGIMLVRVRVKVRTRSVCRLVSMSRYLSIPAKYPARPSIPSTIHRLALKNT